MIYNILCFKPFQIICWNAKTLKSVWSIPTLGGFVYSLAACPMDPGCVALGVGDNMIRVWNTSAGGRGYVVNALWQGINSKVTAVRPFSLITWILDPLPPKNVSARKLKFLRAKFKKMHEELAALWLYFDFRCMLHNIHIQFLYVSFDVVCLENYRDEMNVRYQ